MFATILAVKIARRLERRRTGIFEVFLMSPAVQEAVLAGATHAELLALARGEGMMTLMEAGLEKVFAGLTTLEELLRVATL